MAAMWKREEGTGSSELKIDPQSVAKPLSGEVEKRRRREQGDIIRALLL